MQKKVAFWLDLKTLALLYKIKTPQTEEKILLGFSFCTILWQNPKKFYVKALKTESKNGTMKFVVRR